MCLCGHLGEQFLFAGRDFSSVFPGLMSWHCYDQIFQCSSSFLLGWMQWKSECFFFFFSPSKILPFCKFLPGRNPKQPSQLPCLLSPHVLAAHFCFLQLWSLFGLQLSVILLSRSLGLQLPQQVEQKSMLKTLKERSGGEKWKEMSRRGKKRQNKHSCRVRTDYIFIFFKKVSGYVLKSSCCCSFQK